MPPSAQTKIDINDTLRTEGAEAVRKRHDRASKVNKPTNADKAPAMRGLPLTFFDELAEHPPPKPWLIKGVIARDEISSWIGPPGKGKSALLTDIAVHNAADVNNWRGYSIKGRSGVVYFAMERADLVRRRLIAHKRRDHLASLPIAVVSQVVDLLNKSCIEAILATIRTAEQRFGLGVGLVIFDTYNKGIAAGGGDEDKARDQNIVQANLRRLFDKDCHIHIAGVGHTGKDPTRGERGSNARLADVDLQVQIDGETIKTATVTKANDQAEGPITAFKLEPYDFGPDQDGEPFRTFILAPELFAGEESQRASRMSNSQTLALRALEEVTLAQGRDPPAEYCLPRGIKVIDANTWQKELVRCRAINPESANPRARFNELRQGLAARRLIGNRDDTVWLVQGAIR
jgi:hypothetical protein